MPEDARFSKSLRLLARGDFKRVFDMRMSVADKLMVVYVAPNDLPHSRIGLVVSRKVGNAVVRNRWKRLLRESFRLQQHALPPGWDFVVLPRGRQAPELDGVASSFDDLAGRVVRKANKNASASKDGKIPSKKPPAVKPARHSTESGRTKSREIKRQGPE